MTSLPPSRPIPSPSPRESDPIRAFHSLIPPLSSNSSNSDATKMPHSHVKHSSQDTKKSQTKVLKSPNRPQKSPKNAPKREIPIKFPKPNKTNLKELISQKPGRVEDRRQPPKVSKYWRDCYSSCSNPPISESTSSNDADDEGFANGRVENNDSETDNDTTAYKPPKQPSKGHRCRRVVESEHDSGSVSNDADCSNSDNTNGHGSDSTNNSDGECDNSDNG
ncbi:hypothetical protein PtA15_17A214 [Puccinia triticina]|uniref:Uncharacterized protein n=1 Tax=Puccinia triticina TaxID=208348 RepID=A0ABY7D8X1_9BASI|nr:uncharacterized protein PtA15_17A214 [Puccinia triticina]WAQ92732.1 hypothetical protein PtA15_17A214 [Puccinia triticina]